MALRTRQQHMENVINKPLAVAGKTRGANNQGRTALGYIQNKMTNPTGNTMQVSKPAIVKGKLQTRSSANLNKENTQLTKSSSLQNEKKIIDAPKAEIEELNESLMDISLVEPDGFSSSILPKGITDIDSCDSDNQFLCSDLVMDIYKYLRELEVKWSIQSDFLSQQTDITPRMRTILVDWLNQVHTRFGLLQETLYLTVATLDRFLQNRLVSRKHLQLVGITAMFIASKYEEMYSPATEDFVFITDNAYSKQDIFKMECIMLKALDFSFSRPLPLHFLRRNSKAADCDGIVHTLAKFFMEISLQDYELASVSPSLLAASALYLSLKVMDNAPWTPDLEFYSGYKEKQVQSTVTQIAKLVLKNGASKHQAVYKKYTSSKFMKVSCLPHLKSETMMAAAEGKMLE